MEDYVYKAPALRLDLGQFAKVRIEAKEWKVFDNSFKPGEKESRLPVRVLEGAEVGLLKTLRTRSDDLVFQTIDIAKKLDLLGLEFWIQKKEKLNKSLNPFSFFVASTTKPSPATNP